MFYANTYTCRNAINFSSVLDIIKKWVEKYSPSGNSNETPDSISQRFYRDIQWSLARLMMKDLKVCEQHAMNRANFKQLFEGNKKNHFLQAFLKTKLEDGENLYPFYTKFTTTPLISSDSQIITNLSIPAAAAGKKYMADLLSEYYSFMIQLTCHILCSLGYFSGIYRTNYIAIGRMLDCLLVVKKSRYADEETDERIANSDIYKKWVKFFTENSDKANLIITKNPLLNIFLGKGILSTKMNSTEKILALFKSQLKYFTQDVWWKIADGLRKDTLNNYFNNLYGELPNLDNLVFCDEKTEITVKEFDSDIVMEGTLIEV